MNGQTRKHIIKCFMCNEEIKESLSSHFADLYNCLPCHLECRIVIEMPSAKVPDTKPTVVLI